MLLVFANATASGAEVRLVVLPGRPFTGAPFPPNTLAGLVKLLACTDAFVCAAASTALNGAARFETITDTWLEVSPLEFVGTKPVDPLTLGRLALVGTKETIPPPAALVGTKDR